MPPTDSCARMRRNYGPRERLLAVPDSERGWEWHHLSLKADSSSVTLDSSAAWRDRMSKSRPTSVGAATRWCSAAEDESSFFRRVKRSMSGTFRRLAPDDRTPAPGSILAVHESGLMLVSEKPLGGNERPPPGIAVPRIYRPDSSPRRVIGAFEVEPNCADVTPDGLRIVVGLQPAREHTEQLSSRRHLRNWSTAPAKQIARLVPVEPAVRDLRAGLLTPCTVKFSPDGSMVAFSGGTVHVWRAESRRADQLRPHAARLFQPTDRVQPGQHAPRRRAT